LEVIDETAELVGQLIRLSALPVLRKSRQRVLALVASVVSQAAATPPATPALG
jgi:hypothetical protein